VDRLLKAKYLGVNADACFVDIPAGAYDVWGITYDKIGNIKTLLRNGMTNDAVENPVFDMIDNLTFSHTGSSMLSGPLTRLLLTKDLKLPPAPTVTMALAISPATQARVSRQGTIS
jgi:hypothetical protein